MQMPINHFESVPSSVKVNFAVLRDPFTRLQSIFAHAKDTYPTYNIKYFTDLDDLAKAYYHPHHPHHREAVRMFDWNIYQLEHSFKRGTIQDECVDKEGSMIHFAPQTLYVEGHPASCEYLLRFEHLDEDLDALIRQKTLPEIVTNLAREKTNVSSSTSKQLAVITPIVRQLVHTVYARDIVLHQSLHGFSSR